MKERSCPECGMNLTSEERACPVCGTRVSRWKANGNTYRRRNPKAKRAQVKAFITFLFFGCITIAKLLHAMPLDNKIADTKQTASEEIVSVSSLRGCPEFYNVEWKMTVDEVERLVGENCDIRKDTSESGKDCIYLYPGTGTEYLGSESSLAAAVLAKREADGLLSLNSVYFTFEEDCVSFDEMHDKITQKYGQSNVENMWVGPYTIITIERIDNEEFFVNYTYSYNIVVLDEQPCGPDIDPLGLAGENSVLGKNLDVYLLDIPSDDYLLSEENGKRTCRLYNGIRYIDRPREEIHVRLTADKGGKIESIEYVFPLYYDETDNVPLVLDTIQEELNILYGNAVSCSFRSFDGPYRAESNGNAAIMAEIKAGGHGVYEILWKGASARFSLNAKSKIYTGSVKLAEEYTIDA